MIKSFDVASDTVLHGTHILKNVIGSNVFRVNHTSDIETVDHVIKGKAVYFCNQFGFGYGFGKKCKEYVFFVQVCKRDKGFCTGESLFHKERTIGTVAIDNGRFRDQVT